jgi:hypothetical protein
MVRKLTSLLSIFAFAASLTAVDLALTSDEAWAGARGAEQGNGNNAEPTSDPEADAEDSGGGNDDPFNPTGRLRGNGYDDCDIIIESEGDPATSDGTNEAGDC